MTDTTDIVHIGLAVDSSSVRKGTSELDKLEKQGKETKRATDGLASAFKFLGAAIGATAGIAIFKAIDAHREFSKAVSELSAITGATGKDLAFFRQQALNLGSSTTYAASEVVTAFKLVASAMPSLLESKDALVAVTKEVLTLAEASGMSLPDAAKALGGAMNQFGADAAEASRFINVLAAGAKLGASEVNETAEAMKNVGAVASNLGLSFEEANAAIQAMAAVSLKGAEAGTGLRGVLLKLSTQSRDEFNPEIVGLSAALKNLQEAHLTTAEKADLFGQESITAATALITQADAVAKLTTDLHGTTTAYEQASTNTDNLDSDMKKMWSSFSGTALTLGETFDPALRMTVQLLTWVGKAAQSLSVALGDIGDMIGSYAAATAAMMAGDLSGARAILDMREVQSEAATKRLDEIWAEKVAVEKSAETIKAAADAEAESVKKSAEIRAAAAVAAAARRDEEYEKDRLMGEKKYNTLEGFIKKENDRIAAENERKLAQQNSYYERLYNLETGSVQASHDFANAIRKMDYKSAVDNGALMLSNLAKTSRAAFNIQKAAALAKAIATLPSAVMQSYDAGGGWPWGLIPAGLMLAEGLSQISAIRSATFGGGTTASVPGGSTSPSAPSGSLPPGSTAIPSGGEQQQPVQYNFYYTGTFVDTESFVEQNVIPSFQAAIKNRDVIVIDPRSRQAALLQGAPA